MRTGVLIWALGLSCAALAIVPAQAQYDDEWRQREGYDSGQLLPLDRILPGVRRDHPGRFYDAEGPFQGSDGQMHYRLKWMTPEGRIVWFDTNARTGRVLGSGGGRRELDNPGGSDTPDERGGQGGEGRRDHFNDQDGGPDGDGNGGGQDRDWSNDRGRGDWNGGRGSEWGEGHEHRRPHLLQLP